LIDQGLTSH